MTASPLLNLSVARFQFAKNVTVVESSLGRVSIAHNLVEGSFDKVKHCRRIATHVTSLQEITELRPVLPENHIRA